MLNFDGFQSRERAEAFAAAVEKRTGRKATVYDSQAESFEVDYFPLYLEPPIVLVERFDDWSTEDELKANVQAEKEVEALVEEFGGTFAGT
jgi:hypothetical protein